MGENKPRLIDVSAPRDPDGLVLVLHGGASRKGSPMVSPAQLSVLRMVPIAHRLVRAGQPRLAVFRLLNAVRGWDTRHTPVEDVRWALDELGARYPQLPPVGLVGHSLGGRAALLAGAQPSVRSVVALNPWVYPNERVDLVGRAVLIVHGSADRIAKPASSAAVARRLAGTAHVSYVSVRGGKHAMLARHAVFGELASDFTVTALLGAQADSHPASAPPWREV